MGTFPTGPTLVAKQRAVKTSFARKEREKNKDSERKKEKRAIWKGQQYLPRIIRGCVIITHNQPLMSQK
jgi:hypothetical protein